jgi:hypothetical protein
MQNDKSKVKIESKIVISFYILHYILIFDFCILNSCIALQ